MEDGHRLDAAAHNPTTLLVMVPATLRELHDDTVNVMRGTAFRHIQLAAAKYRRTIKTRIAR